MSEIITRTRIVSAALCAAVLFGCAAAPTLVSKSAATPVGVDLSGRWQLREGPAQRAQRKGSLAKEPPIYIGDARRSQRKRRDRRSGRNSVQIFLEQGELLKISQTGFGLFISYDRSVVEEYTFGENRTVSIGPIEALRVSGWEGGSFVVETLDGSGATLFERWTLRDEGTSLFRDVRIVQEEQTSLTLQHIYDRL